MRRTINKKEALKLDTDFHAELEGEVYFTFGNNSGYVYGHHRQRQGANKMIDLLFKEKKEMAKSTAVSRLQVAAIKGEENYQWFEYTGKLYPLPFRTNTYGLSKGDVFGVRYSANGKDRRLILKDLGPSKVFTLTDEQNTHLAKNSREI